MSCGKTHAFKVGACLPCSISDLRAENARLMEKLHAAEREVAELKGQIDLVAAMNRGRMSSDKVLNSVVTAALSVSEQAITALTQERDALKTAHTALRDRLTLLFSQLPSQYQGEIADMLGECE